MRGARKLRKIELGSKMAKIHAGAGLAIEPKDQQPSLVADSRAEAKTASLFCLDVVASSVADSNPKPQFCPGDRDIVLATETQSPVMEKHVFEGYFRYFFFPIQLKPYPLLLILKSKSPRPCSLYFTLFSQTHDPTHTPTSHLPHQIDRHHLPRSPAFLNTHIPPLFHTTRHSKECNTPRAQIFDFVQFLPLRYVIRKLLPSIGE